MQKRLGVARHPTRVLTCDCIVGVVGVGVVIGMVPAVEVLAGLGPRAPVQRARVALAELAPCVYHLLTAAIHGRVPAHCSCRHLRAPKPTGRFTDRAVDVGVRFGHASQSAWTWCGRQRGWCTENFV